MKRFPALNNALRALAANKARTLLTMLGIIIGVGAVVIMVSLGAGAGKSVSSRIESLGSNLLTITPGAGAGQGGGARGAAGSGTGLSLGDSEAISKEIPEVLRVSPEYSSSEQVVYGSQNINATINGVTPAYEKVRNAAVEVGRFVDDADDGDSARVAVVGRNIVDDLFGGENPIGRTIRIGTVPVQVIGVMASKGGSSFNSPDDAIFVPLSTAQKRLFGEDHLRQIGVQVRDADVMTQAADRITLLLLGRHGTTNPDEAEFRVLNQQDILQTASQVTGIFTLLLGGIASVSLLVGGIGIMNIMLVSVTERTREIGLRKAVGARRADIMRQFLTESVVLSVMGGILGILIGIGGSAAMGAATGMETAVSTSSVAMAFLFSAGIGVFFGVFPAMRAARLDPIEALRYQ